MREGIRRGNTGVGVVPKVSNVSKQKLLQWVEVTLQLKIPKLELLSSGAVYCQLVDAFQPGTVPMQKVNFLAREEHEAFPNYKYLQAAFEKLEIRKAFDINKLSEGSTSHNLGMLQFLSNFFQDKAVQEDYNPEERRKLSVKGGTNNIPAPTWMGAAFNVYSKAYGRSLSTIPGQPLDPSVASSMRTPSTTASRTQSMTASRTQSTTVPRAQSTRVSRTQSTTVSRTQSMTVPRIGSTRASRTTSLTAPCTSSKSAPRPALEAAQVAQSTGKPDGTLTVPKLKQSASGNARTAQRSANAAKAGERRQPGEPTQAASGQALRKVGGRSLNSRVKTATGKDSAVGKDPATGKDSATGKSPATEKDAAAAKGPASGKDAATGKGSGTAAADHLFTNDLYYGGDTKVPGAIVIPGSPAASPLPHAFTNTYSNDLFEEHGGEHGCSDPRKHYSTWDSAKENVVPGEVGGSKGGVISGPAAELGGSELETGLGADHGSFIPATPSPAARRIAVGSVSSCGEATGQSVPAAGTNDCSCSVSTVGDSSEAAGGSLAGPSPVLPSGMTGSDSVELQRAMAAALPGAAEGGALAAGSRPRTAVAGELTARAHLAALSVHQLMRLALALSQQAVEGLVVAVPRLIQLGAAIGGPKDNLQLRSKLRNMQDSICTLARHGIPFQEDLALLVDVAAVDLSVENFMTPINSLLRMYQDADRKLEVIIRQLDFSQTKAALPDALVPALGGSEPPATDVGSPRSLDILLHTLEAVHAEVVEQIQKHSVPGTAKKVPDESEKEATTLRFKRMRNGDSYWSRYASNGSGPASFMYNFINGDLYMGDWARYMHGHGVYVFSSGRRYEGQWTEGVYDGFGRDFFSRGSTYTGAYSGGARGGYGVCRFHNGQYYEGLWQRGLPHTAGMQYLADGACYVGEFQAGQRLGFGVYCFPSGDRYVGQHEADVPHGMGIHVAVNGDVYEGEWVHGRKSGRGVITKSGERWAGTWEGGKASSIQLLSGSQEPGSSDVTQFLEAASQARKAAEQATRRAHEHMHRDGVVQRSIHASVASATTAARLGRSAQMSTRAAIL